MRDVDSFILRVNSDGIHMTVSQNCEVVAVPPLIGL